MKNSKSVKAIAFIAMFAALHIILEIAFDFLPSQPQGGNISLSLLPILLASYLIGVKEGLCVGLISTLLQFVLGLAKFYGPWSVVLDYLIPITIVGAAAFFKNIKMGQYTLYTGIIVTMVLKFASHFASGAWLFAEYAPEGINVYYYSLTYNIVYCLPTLIICYIAFVIIYPRLKKSIRL